MTRRKSNDAKRAISFDGGSSKNNLEIKDKPKFKKLVSSQVRYKFPKSSGDSVSNPKLKKGKGTNSPSRSQLMECVARSTMVIALRRRIIVLVLARVGTSLGIALM